MIVFGCAVTRPDMYERWAAPGIASVRELDSVVYPNSSAGSIFRAYNLLLDMARAHDDLEALVLLHQDVEIVDRDFCAKVRRCLADPEVAVAGCVGALDARSMAWWEGAVTWASFTHRYYEHGGGELPAFAMDPDRSPLPPYARSGEVDTIDGFLMVLSPWTVRELRFDESLGQFDGYDFDLCLQVRDAGRKVVAADLKVVHHHSLELMSNPDRWIEANVRLIEKWEERFPRLGAQMGTGSNDWKARARRAEAEAAAAKTMRISAQMQASARERELQRQIDEMSSSSSWRVTRPLRWISQQLRARQRRDRRGG
jgi:GT2 family glycosyltransferase